MSAGDKPLTSTQLAAWNRIWDFLLDSYSNQPEDDKEKSKPISSPNHLIKDRISQTSDEQK